ncbi:ABC transporter G family member 9 [Hondaea fermentalgiana]|uniref:ABC transporter G family member 9 n=1 Tax=Hondaea fermentalgiana TaxID=2315210 RepID=A0A2R5G489_9STRA|nr:ABC transporter G family member 9 [Hondaea fermentalgiana]|eukprot:GBG24598.1 ABC transporter G family member 9 [Hondaea fermentalgiana]
MALQDHGESTRATVDVEEVGPASANGSLGDGPENGSANGDVKKVDEQAQVQQDQQEVATTPAKSGGEKDFYGELEFTPNFAALAKSSKPTSLEWEDVYLQIKGRDILKRISGKVGSHELMALIGASGAGKSSLMNVLAGRISGTGKKVVSGNVYVNGAPVNPIRYRKNVAYVLQEDALFATATAREALEFSAKLRLPNTVSAEERKQIVDELMVSLGIDHVANTMCGSEMVRGLSGGEKKRVSIGIELVTSPSILFLDEPTSGLDSYSSWKVVSILKALSRSGCAVLCTIHQPSSETFSIFDKVMALAHGNIIYNGQVATIPENFSNHGFPLPPNTNPADFILLLAQTKKENDLPRINEEAGKASNVEIMVEGSNNNETDDALAKRQGSSIQVPAGHGELFDGERTASSVWTQLSELTKRELRNIVRDKGALIGRFGITAFLNILFALIFLGSADINDEGYELRGHFGALTNMFIGAMFGASQPVLLTLPMERVTFLREYSTGSYRSTPYFLSKVAIECILYFLTSLLVVIIEYWLVDYQGNFFALVGELFMLSLVSASYAFFAGSLAPDVKSAQEIAPLVFVPQLLFTGLFVSVDQIPVFLRWAQWLCSLTYGLNLGMITEFGGNRCEPSNPNSPSSVIACQMFLEEMNVETDMVGFYIGMQVAIFALFRIGALFALVWKARNFTS